MQQSWQRAFARQTIPSAVQQRRCCRHSKVARALLQFKIASRGRPSRSDTAAKLRLTNRPASASAALSAPPGVDGPATCTSSALVRLPAAVKLVALQHPTAKAGIG